MTDRRLPAHIEAALRGNPSNSGNTADSAGQSWVGRDLSGEGNPLHAFDNDDGGVPASYEAAIARLVAGETDEPAVVRTLSAVRVFVPVVAVLGGHGPEVTDGGGAPTGSHAGDKEADMALVTLKTPDGRTALPVFTSTDRLRRWHPDARPVAVFAPRAALAAVAEECELMVIDAGSEVTYVVRRPAVWALAQQHEWVPSYTDTEVARIVGSAVTSEANVLRVEVGPGAGVSSRTGAGTVVPGGGSGPELRLTMTLREGLSQEDVRSTVRNVQDHLQNQQSFVERVDSLEIRLTR